MLRDGPVTALDVLPHLEGLEVPVHATLQLLGISGHGIVDRGERLAEFVGWVPAGGADADVGFEGVFWVCSLRVGLWEQEEEVLVDGGAEGLEEGFGRGDAGWLSREDLLRDEVLEHELVAGFKGSVVEFEH